MDEVIIVASTHWDREWYRSFSEFRVRLCELINRLLPLLEEGVVDCYTFDGQSAVWEDYLEAYPENEDRLRKLAREGKLMFGPLYKLPDEFLSGGEALIRNFLMGDELCSRIGGKCRAGYLPDNFGHVSQLPQILKGSGLDAAFFFQGADLQNAEQKKFWWIAPDNSRVLGLQVPLGYWSLKSWDRQGKSVAGHFLEAYEHLKNTGVLGHVLLVKGSEHPFQNPALPELAGEARQAGSPLKGAEPGGKALGEVRGELRDFHAGPDPTGVCSCRGSVKRGLFEAKAELLRYAEPLAAWRWALGGEYPEGILNHAWKDLLKALGHDGVSGCSSDPVMADIDSYLRHAREEAASLSALSLAGLFSAFPPLAENESGFTLFVFNPLRYSYAGIITAELCIEDENTRDFTLIDENGTPVEWEYISSRQDISTREFDYDSRERVYQRCFTIRFWVEDLRPLSIRRYALKPSALREFRRKELTVRLKPSIPVIQNEYYIIEAEADTSLRVTLKESGKVFPGLNLLVSRGEAGDTYHHVSPLADEHTFPVLSGISVRVNSSLASELCIRGELRPPAGSAEDFLGRRKDRACCAFETRVLLSRFSPLIDIRTEFDNRAEDHILFAGFPVPFEGAWDFSQIAFDEIRRSDTDTEFRPESNSAQSALRSFEGYAGLRFPGGDIVVTSRGLSEYHTKQRGEETIFYLSLLRSTGWMFHGLPRSWREGQQSAAPLIETPKARELGRNVFEYAFMLNTDQALFHAEAYRFPPRSALFKGKPVAPPAAPGRENPLPDFSFTDERIGQSALKKWRFGKGLLLRLFNTSDDTVSFSFRPGSGTVKVSQADLLEKPGEEIPLHRGLVSLVAPPRRIITLILHRD
ncbi:MAG: hypothetical protein LBH26_06640 [Treponema sp.]|jgi:alpha-mannosidase|nr:hypothetical protein [Treponema sp.]